MKTETLFRLSIPHQQKELWVSFHDHDCGDGRKVICITDMYSWRECSYNGEYKHHTGRFRGHTDLVTVDLEQAEEFAEKLLEHIKRIKNEQS